MVVVRPILCCRGCGFISAELVRLSDPAMEEALYETTFLRQFSGLGLERIPDETTILNFRRLLEKQGLVAGILGVINGYMGHRGLSLR
ncbi:transposase [Pseudomonas khavaziana]|uniref:transposase n=1 Tax=Pseudomonas khavaziana TaxID=2842351 RepID=UPI0021F327B1|nr:transposase [Pseudomonas khavaziana]